MHKYTYIYINVIATIERKYILFHRLFVDTFFLNNKLHNLIFYGNILLHFTIQLTFPSDVNTIEISFVPHFYL